MAVQKTLKTLLMAETEARKMVTEAEKQAKDIKEKATEEVQKLIEEAKAREEQESNRVLEEARRQIQQKAKDINNEAEKKIQLWEELFRKNHDQAVDFVIKSIIDRSTK
ncbi:hypothetical protein GF312_08270 [Candidatus Poribacteria bacterium]|nr:hypothetical protein [Candidatus Poribacteria bacterium]